MSAYTAEIRNWRFQVISEDYVIAWGNIYDDQKGRWRDGAGPFHTSAIVTWTVTPDHIDVVTLNSHYLLKKDQRCDLYRTSIEDALKPLEKVKPDKAELLRPCIDL